MALGRRLRVGLAQLEHVRRAASREGVDHVDILVDQSTDDVLAYLLVETGGFHWMPMYRRRDGALVHRNGTVITYGEGAA